MLRTRIAPMLGGVFAAVLTVCGVVAALPSAAVAAGGIPADQLPPDGFGDVQWQDPQGWSTIDVSRNGLAPDQPGIDAAAAVAAIMARTSGRRIVYFPAGTYYFRSTLTITVGDVILRGAGMSRTKLVIDGPEQPNAEIRFAGAVRSTTTAAAVQGSPAAGDASITVADGSRFRAGDSIQLYLAGGRIAYSHPTEMQLLRVRAVSGDRLDLDMKLGLSYPAGKQPMVRSIVALHNVGVEQLKVERLREPTEENVNNIVMRAVDNAFVRDIESDKAGRHHVSLEFARDTVVERTYLHGGFRDRGGYIYGAGASWSTRVRMTDNKAYDLRHFFVLQLGTNHSVVSYNSAEPPYRDYNDVALHANYANLNLFEGNTFHEGYADNSKSGSMSATGPGNVWFRNQAAGQLGSINGETSGQVIVGNLVGSLRLLGSSHFAGANRVAGQDVWGRVPAGTPLPDSLYLTAKPAFFGNRPWPVYGPGVAAWGVGNAPPARGRAKRGVVHTDPLTDLSKTVRHSAGLRIDTTNPDNFGGDSARATPTQPGAQTLTYFEPGTHQIKIVAHYWPNEPVQPIQLSVSEDGETWRSVTIRTTDRGGNWRTVEYDRAGLENVDYLTITLPATTGETWAQQIGSVVITN